MERLSSLNFKKFRVGNEFFYREYGFPRVARIFETSKIFSRIMRWIWIWIAVIATQLPTATPWKTDRRPRLYGDRIPTKVLIPSTRKVQKKIVLYHNFFRTHVTPPAANMLAMKWHRGAARAAQRWAESCLALTHDNATGLHIDAFGSCGQNIFISTAQVPWFFAIKTWYLEKEIFKYGTEAENDLTEVGHYTQMVWAPTHRVGCGFAKCPGTRGPRGRPYFSYVCNYCPAGNHPDRLGIPYVEGQPCSGCKDHCRLGKLCKNSCAWADLWANCRQLYETWPTWLCESDTEQGIERRKFCRATCKCRDKIV